MVSRSIVDNGQEEDWYHVKSTHNLEFNGKLGKQSCKGYFKSHARGMRGCLLIRTNDNLQCNNCTCGLIIASLLECRTGEKNFIEMTH